MSLVEREQIVSPARLWTERVKTAWFDGVQVGVDAQGSITAEELLRLFTEGWKGGWWTRIWRPGMDIGGRRAKFSVTREGASGPCSIWFKRKMDKGDLAGFYVGEPIEYRIQSVVNEFLIGIRAQRVSEHNARYRVEKPVGFLIFQEPFSDRDRKAEKWMAFEALPEDTRKPKPYIFPEEEYIRDVLEELGIRPHDLSADNMMNLKDGGVGVVDMEEWEIIRQMGWWL